MDVTISIIPWIIGGVFNMILGALWYSKVLLGKAWMAEASITEEQISDTSGMGKVYGLTMFTAFLTSYVVGFIITNMGVDNILNGLLVALLVWIGMDFSMIIKNWGFEGRTIKLGLINHGYQLVVYIVVSVLFILL